MKRILKQSMALCALLALLVTAIMSGASVQAAKKPKLNKKKVVLNVGQSCRLKVKNTKKKVKWKTSKRKVATVSQKGVVKARKKGTAKITARIGKKRLACKVTVRKKTSAPNSATPQSGSESSGNGNSSTGVTATVTPTADKTETYQKKVLELVNEERAKQGVAPLVLDSALCQVAMLRANELVDKFSHTRPNGTVCFTAVKEAGISYRAIAENIAAGQRTPAAVMNSWMNSSGHRGNILSSNYGKMGMGYVTGVDGYGTYWVQIFTN